MLQVLQRASTCVVLRAIVLQCCGGVRGVPTRLVSGGPRAGKSGSGPAKAPPVKRRAVMRPLPSDPLFRDVWRRFQLSVHPDLFAQFPELQAVNSASLQKLQGILNEARTSAERATDEMQRPRTEVLELFLRDPAPEGAPADAPPAFLRVPLTIRLQGANSHHVLAEAMSTLFRHARLPTRFRWGDGFWGSTYVDRPDPDGEQ